MGKKSSGSVETYGSGQPAGGIGGEPMMRNMQFTDQDAQRMQAEPWRRGRKMAGLSDLRQREPAVDFSGSAGAAPSSGKSPAQAPEPYQGAPEISYGSDPLDETRQMPVFEAPQQPEQTFRRQGGNGAEIGNLLRRLADLVRER